MNFRSNIDIKKAEISYLELFRSYMKLITATTTFHSLNSIIATISENKKNIYDVRYSYLKLKRQ